MVCGFVAVTAGPMSVDCFDRMFSADSQAVTVFVFRLVFRTAHRTGISLPGSLCCQLNTIARVVTADEISVHIAGVCTCNSVPYVWGNAETGRKTVGNFELVAFPPRHAAMLPINLTDTSIHTQGRIGGTPWLLSTQLISSCW